MLRIARVQVDVCIRIVCNMAEQSSRVRRVLVADDDQFALDFAAVALESIGIEVLRAVDGKEAVEKLDSSLDAILLDLDMPEATGLEVLRVASSKAAGVPVVVLSATGEVDDAVVALKQGAFDFITKPCDAEGITSGVKAAFRATGFRATGFGGSDAAELASGERRPQTRISIVSESERSQAVLSRAERCARVDSTVLVTGPSGTGKSMLARWVHEQGVRREGPFVTVNCGALPRELIESELFGHMKGAFTGAHQDRIGRFEAANGGTLFLDEIGELPIDLQPKLLSALQSRSSTRVGGTAEVSHDVRLIAATNRDLEAAIEQGSFREDLYYRLNVLTIEMPALRERVDDILPLAELTLGRIADRLGLQGWSLSEEARKAICGYRWPGNVRELENVLERAAVFCDRYEIGVEDLYLPVAGTAGPSDASLVGVSLAELEKRAILATLESTGGNRAEAARLLGVSERTIYNRLKEFSADEAGDATE